MPKRSKADETIHRADLIGRSRPAEGAAKLHKTMRRTVRTDDIPELNGHETPVVRDSAGRLPRGRLGPVREAIMRSLDNHGMTRYELWNKAQVHRATLSRSAVYEYLRGVRDLGIEYAEALMTAANLKIVAQRLNEEQVPKARRRGE